MLNLFQHLIKPSREKIAHGCICAIFFSLPIAEQENLAAKQTGKPLGQCRKLNKNLSFGYAEIGGGILYIDIRRRNMSLRLLSVGEALLYPDINQFLPFLQRRNL